ncbi:hypothetical protein GDO78_012225 [Eleutherodactylus coqui]|uniref:Uncharacterized protein n=1 Tax=Eleutherodactylus coqui TaxID=57060 RepID=A0A8J6F4Z6_ELECQ|nr:hypothetical protein GDO78_012225 [Eleutherodactylus coqui]
MLEDVLWSSLTLLLSCSFHCGNVLVWPAENSHLMSLKPIVQELLSRGHNVTMLVPTASQQQVTSQSSNLHLEMVEVKFTAEELHAVWERYLHFWIYERHEVSMWRMYSRLRALSRNVTYIHEQICDGILRSKRLLEKLGLASYDIVLSDPVLPCGDLLAEKLHVPFVFTLRFSPGSVFERLCGKLPTPASFVPAATSELKAQMCFLERVQNVLSYLVHDLLQLLVWKQWDNFYSNILGEFQ